MTVYVPLDGVSLLTGSSDPDVGDPRTVAQVNGVTPGSWPYATTTSLGLGILVYQDGSLAYDVTANTDHPLDGSTSNLGTFTYALTDGTATGNTATITVSLTGYATLPSESDVVQNGLVMDFRADAGVTLSATDVTTWADQAGAVSAAAVGAPQMGTSPGGTIGTSIIIPADTGLTFSDLSTVPVGAAERTMQAVWSSQTGNFWFGGFGYGNSSLNTNFSIAVDDSGQLALDIGSDRILLSITPTDQWTIVSATYDGTTVKVWVGQVLVASLAVTLATGTVRGNIGRSFSNVTTTCGISRAVVYGRVLSDAEILSNVAILNGQFVGNVTVTNHAAVTASAINSGGFTFSGTATGTFGYIAYSIRTNATPATEGEIIAGTGALEFGIIPIDSLSSFSHVVTGAASATGYYINTIEYDLTGGKTGVVTSALITTDSVSTAPTAIDPTSVSTSDDFPTGNTLATLVANQPGATFSEITDTANAFAVSSAGIFSTTTALVAAQSPYSFVARATNSAGTFDQAITVNVSSASVSNYTPDSTGTTPTEVNSIIAAWVANPSGTAPSGKSATDTRVVQLTQPYTGDWVLNSYDASAITGGIIVRGVAPYTYQSAWPYAPRCGSHVTGKISTPGCKNIGLALISCTSFDTSSMPVGMFIDRFSAASEWSTSVSVPTVVGALLKNSPSGIITNSYFGGYKDYNIGVQGGMDDLVMEGNFFEYARDDFIKQQGGSGSFAPRWKVRRNWSGRFLTAGASSHSDWFQMQLGSTMDDLEFYGNVAMEGGFINDVHLAFLFMSQATSSANNAVVEQNIAAITRTQAYNIFGTNKIGRYNDAVQCEQNSHGSVQAPGNAAPSFGGFQTKEYNISCKKTSGAADSAGTGGVNLVTGDIFNNGGVVNTSQYPTYYAGFPTWNTYIDSLLPPSSSAPTHWNYVGQKVGAYLRKQEIAEGGITPSHVGWPVAGPHARNYAPIGSAAHTTIGSTFTGNHGSNGENV